MHVASNDEIFAAPLKVEDPAECDFYHTMEVPGHEGDFVPYPAKKLEELFVPRAKHLERLKNSYWFLPPNQATQNVHTPYARLKMIEMVRAAFGRAQVCEERLKKIDVEEVVYFLKRAF